MHYKERDGALCALGFSFIACTLRRVKIDKHCMHSKSLFSSSPNPKKFAQYPSHRIFGRMHGTLNIGKKITNYTACL
jgi:hypothetical protein